MAAQKACDGRDRQRRWRWGGGGAAAAAGGGPLAAQPPHPAFQEDAGGGSLLSSSAFFSAFAGASPQQPVVLLDLLAAWPALQRWRHLDYWSSSAGHRTVPIERGLAEPAGRSSGIWREELVLFREFLERDMAGSLREMLGTALPAGSAGGGGGGGSGGDSSSIAYMAQHGLFEQCPALRDKGDFELPRFVREGLGEEAAEGAISNIWMGTRGTVTHCHFDSYENILCQVAGFKFVRLFAPGEGGMLYARGKEGAARQAAQGNLSAVDVEAEGGGQGAQFPLFEVGRCLDAVLAPGDAVFIPAGWWHYCRALSPSISVNFWWTPASAINQVV